MKVIIAGSRNFKNYDLIEQTMAELGLEVDEVVCGGARGADRLGEQWAKNHNIPVTYFPAKWSLFGKSAGFIRNEEMAEYADYLIAFWDKKSRGTRHMIKTMRKHCKHGTVIIYEL